MVVWGDNQPLQPAMCSTSKLPSLRRRASPEKFLTLRSHHEWQWTNRQRLTARDVRSPNPPNKFGRAGNTRLQTVLSPMPICPMPPAGERDRHGRRARCTAPCHCESDPLRTGTEAARRAVCRSTKATRETERAGRPCAPQRRVTTSRERPQVPRQPWSHGLGSTSRLPGQFGCEPPARIPRPP